MYQPGDIVKGYPDFFIDNEVKFKFNEGNIRCAKNRETLVKYCDPTKTSGLHSYWWTKEEFIESDVYVMHYKEIQGIVIQADTMGANKPHLDGAVKILAKDRTLWLWTRNVRPVKLSSGGVK